MMRAVNTTRPYRSAIRAEQARRTRELIIDAARNRFVQSGYSNVSINSIAEAAGVASETVYDIFGTKRKLLEEIVNVTIAGGFDEPKDFLDASWVAILKSLPDAAARVAGFADHTAETLERMAPIHALVRAAAAAEPGLADLPARIHEMRFRRQRQLLELLAGNQLLGTVADAADTFSALASPELHHLLRRIRGWSRSRYAAWLRKTVLATVLRA